MKNISSPFIDEEEDLTHYSRPEELSFRAQQRRIPDIFMEEEMKPKSQVRHYQ